MVITSELLHNLPMKEKREGEKLRRDYPGIDITLTEVFEYIIRHKIYERGDLYRLAAFLQQINIKLPTRDLIIIRRTIPISLFTFLGQLHESSTTNSEVAFFATKLVLGLSDEQLFKLTYNQLRNMELTWPQWFEDIINKQHQYQYDNNLTDDDLFFFSPLKSLYGIKKIVKQTNYRHMEIFCYNIYSYIKQERKFGTSEIVYLEA